MVKLGKAARSVSIVGVGCSRFADNLHEPGREHLCEGDLFGYAALAAMEDAGVEPRDVEYFYHGDANPFELSDCLNPALQVAEWFGMRGKGAVHHSEACCTPYIALELAVQAVASGTYDVVLTGGIGLAKDKPQIGRPACFRREFPFEEMVPGIDRIYDRSYTRSFDGGIGVIFDDWIDEYAETHGMSDEEVDRTLNALAYHCRRAAKLNPRGFWNVDYDDLAAEQGMADGYEYLASPLNPKITHHLRSSGFETGADGAAALIVCATEVAHRFRQAPVEVLGTGACTLDVMNPHNERRATAEAARQVYELTGASASDLDIFYANDFLLPSHMCAAEEVGYLPAGQGWKLAIEGRTAFDGDYPINVNGGRCHFGHAHGASGLADIFDCVHQMRGTAGATQVAKRPKTAMIRGFGGSQNVRCTILHALD